MEAAMKLSCARAEGREGGRVTLGSRYGGISEEQGRESGKFPSLMKKAD
jgi:hypothetical protein